MLESVISTLDAVNEVCFLMEFQHSRQITRAYSGIFNQPPLKYGTKCHYFYSLHFNRGGLVKMFLPLMKAEILGYIIGGS